MSGYDLTTQRGTPTWSTADPKFGTHALSAGVLSVAGVDTFLSSTGANGGTLTTGTIEAWFKTTATDLRIFCGHDAVFWMGVNATGKVEAHYGDNNNGGEVTLSSTTIVNDGAWHHAALVLVNGAGSLYVDGARASTSAVVKIYGTPTNPFSIGGFIGPWDWAGAGGGQIDEVRVSTTARYTGTTYTVPTAAFTVDASARAIYHFDGSGVDGTPPGTLIPADNAAIRYSPYNWKVNTGGVAETINSGAYFRVLVGGSPTSIDLKFDVSGLTAPLPQVKWRLDHGGWASATVAATVNVPIPAGNTWAVHHLEVVVKATSETVGRWVSRAASVKFQGIATDAVTLSPRSVTARPRRVIVYGDSITEGVRTLNQTATNDTDRNDATVGWAYRLGENLGAEVGCVGFGATGIISGGSGGVPALPSSWTSLWSGQARDFTLAPDAVILNIGTNDGSSNTVTAMTGLLNAMLTALTTAKIVVLRPFNGTLQAANLQAAVAACSAPGRVTYVDTAGWWTNTDSSDNLHPYGYVNVADLAPRVASAVNTVLAPATNHFLNVAGSAVPVVASLKAS